jgi:hypothetical protein
MYAVAAFGQLVRKLSAMDRDAPVRLTTDMLLSLCLK